MHSLKIAYQEQTRFYVFCEHLVFLAVWKTLPRIFNRLELRARRQLWGVLVEESRILDSSTKTPQSCRRARSSSRLKILGSVFQTARKTKCSQKT